jgi:eukaryotic-like serine/threonine-protein kinase
MIPKVKLGESLGAGSTGRVHIGEIEDGEGRRLVAVKIFDSMAINRRVIGAELAEVEKMPAHRGVLQALWHDHQSSPAYVVMPFVGRAGPGGWEVVSLEALCGRLKEQEAWPLIEEVASALAHLHRHGVVHANLKPRNVLVTGDASAPCKVTDFGTGWIGGVHHLEFSDHLWHIEPQQWRSPDRIYDGSGASWDVYSFGVLAYRLLTGSFPRGVKAAAKVAEGQSGAVDPAELMAEVEGTPSIAWPDGMEVGHYADRRGIIERCLSFDRGTRPEDMRGVLRAFEKIGEECKLREAEEQLELARSSGRKAAMRWRVASLALGFGLLASGACAVLAAGWAMRAERLERDGAEERLEQGLSQEAELARMVGELERVQGERDVARDNLAASRAAADELFGRLMESLVEAGEAPAGAGREQLLQASLYYENKLVRLGDEVRFLTERARAAHGLAQVRDGLGSEGALESYREASELLEEALEGVGADDPRGGRLVERLVEASMRLGELARAAGQIDEAVEAFAKARDVALGKLEVAEGEVASSERDEAKAWARVKILRAAGGRAEALLASGDAAGALEAAEEGLGLFVGDEEAEAVAGEVGEERGLVDEVPSELEEFVRLHGLAAQAESEQGENEAAMTRLLGCLEKLLPVVEAGASDKLVVEAARVYNVLGSVALLAASSEDAALAHAEAVRIVHPVVMSGGSDVSAGLVELARGYGGVALHDRDAGRFEDAEKRGRAAVELLAHKQTMQGGIPEVEIELTKQEGNLAEILGDTAEAAEGVTVGLRSIERARGLIGDPRLGGGEKRRVERLLAWLLLRTGHAAENSDNKEVAREVFEEAVVRWEEIEKGAEGELQAEAQQAMEWGKRRLDEL